MSFKLRVLTAFLCLIVSKPHALEVNNGATAAPASNPSANIWGIQVGDSVATCRQKIGWQEESLDILARHPFKDTVGFLKRESTVVWTDSTGRNNGWPTYLFGVFGDGTKSNLIDFIQIKDGYKRPLVSGKYQQSLQSIRPGMSILQVYSSIGTQTCEYYMHQSRKWRVVLYYNGLGGRHYRIEADAASGTVILASEGTI